MEKGRRRNGQEKRQPKVTSNNGHMKNGLANGDVQNGTAVKHNKASDGWTVNLVAHKFLPTFLADNEYLLNYHRPQLNSFVACFKSIFRLHTETWNIWTHFGGSLLFVALSIYYVNRAVSMMQTLTFLIFFMGAIICMGCSGLYHTVLCHSEPVYRLFSKIDYVGVIILIMASWAPWLQYGFYCSMRSKIIYSVLVALMGTLCIVAVLHDKFQGKAFRPLRAALFVALGLTGVVPGVHYATVYGVSGQLHMFVWLILMAVIYIFGAGIYAARVPERLLPGKFDIWFQSHQIMHVCVVVAAVFCYHGASMLADHRINGHFDCSTHIPGSEKLAEL